jgi:hypothetical protein
MRQVRATKSVPEFIISYIVRRDAWSLLRDISMGLDGYTHTIPLVEKTPGYAPPRCWKYEDMPKAAEARARDRRKDWLARHFGDVTETLSKMVVTSADIEQLQRLVESDLSLVHAAYYTDEECIARIAAWISGVDAEQPHQDDAVPTAIGPAKG